MKNKLKNSCLCSAYQVLATNERGRRAPTSATEEAERKKIHHDIVPVIGLDIITSRLARELIAVFRSLRSSGRTQAGVPAAYRRPAFRRPDFCLLTACWRHFDI